MARRDTPKPPALWTKQDYAAHYNVSDKTIDEWIRSGKVTEGADYVRTPSGRFRFKPVGHA